MKLTEYFINQSPYFLTAESNRPKKRNLELRMHRILRCVGDCDIIDLLNNSKLWNGEIQGLGEQSIKYLGEVDVLDVAEYSINDPNINVGNVSVWA